MTTDQPSTTTPARPVRALTANPTPTAAAAPIPWSTAVADRAAGVLMGMACGDALGAPFEFGPPLGADHPLGMTGGGGFGWEPGEWTDDTQMAVVILQAAARAVADGTRLTDHLDTVVQGWVDWAAEATDVGNQTRAVLGAVVRGGPISAASAAEAASRFHCRAGRSGGNGSLMRTAPVALAYLDDEPAMAGAARTISELTHADPDAGDACVLWCAAIRHAVLTGELDVRHGLPLLPAERRDLWVGRIEAAEAGVPADFDHNGWVVQALQGAWSAITGTAVPDGAELDRQPGDHLRLAMEAAVRGGRDTDTVAAIAGALLGARWGSSALPSSWRRVVHGWPRIRVTDLGLRGLAVAKRTTDGEWPLINRKDYTHLGVSTSSIAHPHDPGVILGNAGVLDDLPDGIDAVVSLCQVGRRRPTQVEPADHVVVWLVDKDDPADNPNLDLALREAVDVIAALRAEGRTVLLHCAAGQSRTPAVAAAYAVRHLGADPATALDEVCAALPSPAPNSALRAAVGRMTSADARF